MGIPGPYSHTKPASTAITTSSPGTACTVTGFERVLREGQRRQDFTVPYWNYINHHARALPKAIARAGRRCHSLYRGKRNQTRVA